MNYQNFLKLLHQSNLFKTSLSAMEIEQIAQKYKKADQKTLDDAVRILQQEEDKFLKRQEQAISEMRTATEKIYQKMTKIKTEQKQKQQRKLHHDEMQSNFDDQKKIKNLEKYFQ